MRKQYRTKRRSCALCKPHKMGWAKRWKAKEWGKIREMIKEVSSASAYPKAVLSARARR